MQNNTFIIISGSCIYTHLHLCISKIKYIPTKVSFQRIYNSLSILRMSRSWSNTEHVWWKQKTCISNRFYYNYYTILWPLYRTTDMSLKFQ